MKRELTGMEENIWKLFVGLFQIQIENQQNKMRNSWLTGWMTI